MEPATPLSQLVLWVPPAIAAGWERLPPESQQWWTKELTYYWLELITAPGPEPVLLKCGLVRSQAQYDVYRRRQDALEAQQARDRDRLDADAAGGMAALVQLQEDIRALGLAHQEPPP